MAHYRKKPIVIEAWHFTAANASSGEKPFWLLSALHDGRVFAQGGKERYCTIRTLEGEMRASLNDWIIRGVQGEIYPCKPDIFAATYEMVEDQPQ